MFESIVSSVNDFLYSYLLIIVLVAGGLYFTLRTRFLPFRLFKDQLKAVTEKGNGGTSSFQALMISTASRVGTGNIIGVSTAICLGGYGSVFWMWVIAVIGSSSAFIESTLAQIYKKKGKDGCYGGPAYYIEVALKNKALAIVFSVLLILTYGVGFNMLASYNLQSTFSSYEFYENNKSIVPWIIGLILACAVCYCVLGGGKRMTKITEILVPIMGVAYIIVALVIVFINIKSLPGVFGRIFTEAFDFKAIFAGFTGSCIMFGIKRGLFSNEAGVGSAPNASASAEVSHPVKQGLVQVLSVFIDTILVCSATAFLCLCSGVEPDKSLEGAPYVQQSLEVTLGKFGPVFLTVALVLFAFTTLIGNLYYVDKGITYVAGRELSKKTMNIIHIIFSIIIFIGSGLNSGLLWGIADVLMGGMTIINLPVIIILGKYAIRALKNYEMQKKQGVNPVFHAKDINLPHDVDCWK